MSKRIKLDRYDLEAMNEGSAIIKSMRIKKPMGKRLMKIKKMFDRGETILENRAQKRHIL